MNMDKFKMIDTTDTSYTLIATSNHSAFNDGNHSAFNDEINCYLNILEGYRKEIQLLEKKLIELQNAKHPRFSL